MSNSVYGFIKSYIPREERNPKEDYLTQIFAWTLKNVGNMAYMYCEYLYKKMEERIDVSKYNLEKLDKIKEAQNNLKDNKDCIDIKTQVVVDNGSRRIDLLIHVGKESNYGFICEHKVDSGLGKKQIEGYEDSEEFKGTNYFPVLVTKNPISWNGSSKENPWTKLLWEDIYDDVFAKYCCDNTLTEKKDLNYQYIFLVNQIMGYFMEEGLKLAPIMQNEILGYSEFYSTIKEFDKKLDALFGRILEKQRFVNEEINNVGKIFWNLSKSKSGYMPTFNANRWGRKGIDLFPKDNDWKPGVFVGVIMDTKDHKIDPIEPKKSPDFVVILEINERLIDYKKEFDGEKGYYGKMKSYFDREENKNEIEKFGELLDTRDNKKIKYRRFVLRKPLSTILTEESGQIESIQRAMLAGLTLIANAYKYAIEN